MNSTHNEHTAIHGDAKRRRKQDADGVQSAADGLAKAIGLNAESSEQREDDAVHADARRRLRELWAVREALRADRDDPRVLSEWTSVESAIRSCLRELEPPSLAQSVQ